RLRPKRTTSESGRGGRPPAGILRSRDLPLCRPYAPDYYSVQELLSTCPIRTTPSCQPRLNCALLGPECCTAASEGVSVMEHTTTSINGWNTHRWQGITR